SPTDDLNLAITAAKPGSIVTVTVTPNDGNEDGTPVTKQVTIANRAPTTTGIADQSFNGPGEWNLVLAGSFNDPDNEALQFSATLENGDALPAWLHVNANGLLFGNPKEIDAGTYSIKVTATDPSNATATATFTLNVSNTPVSLNDVPVVSSIDFVPAAPLPADTLAANVTASDGDGDTVALTYDWKE